MPKEKIKIEEIEKRAYWLLEKIIKEREKERKRKRYELINQILIKIALGLAIPASFLFPNLPVALKPLLSVVSKNFRIRPQYFLKTIKQLKKQKLITIERKGNKQKVIITFKGKRRVLAFSLNYLKIPQPKNWDGKWRLVIFDIPDFLRNERNNFREILKNLGFYQLQKSIYVYPYPCQDEIDFVSAIFKVYPYLIYLEATKIENEEVLKKFFGLK